MSDAPHEPPPRAVVPVPQSPAPVPAPRPQRSCLGTMAALLGVVLSLIYVLNPTMGVFELIPDNLPVVGNLDEAGATAILIFGLRYLWRREPRSN